MKFLIKTVSQASKDVKIAVLAIYLGMEEEAEAILKRCGQFEMLNKFYQVSFFTYKKLCIFYTFKWTYVNYRIQ